MGLPDIPYVQPEFQGRLETFKKEAAARGIILDSSNLTVVFRNLGRPADFSGDCNSDYSLVEIDETSWKSKGLYAQEQILFHELGHCLLNRATHISDGLAYRGKIIPVSLMAPGGSPLYNENSREYYLNELFDKSRSSDLTADYLVAHNFAIETKSYMIESELNILNIPILAFLDAHGKMKYLNPAECTIIGITDLQHQGTYVLNEIVSVSSELSLQFKKVGRYVINFNCKEVTFTEAFIIS